MGFQMDDHGGSGRGTEEGQAVEELLLEDMSSTHKKGMFEVQVSGGFCCTISSAGHILVWDIYIKAWQQQAK
jgi:hypothetical protein